MQNNHLDIGEVVKQSGLPASTLRFYEEKGLIESIGRNGLRRIFDVRVLERLALITLGRNAGFSLEEIATMFTLDASKINREKLLAKADEIDQKINELITIRDGLRHTAECSAPSHAECPKFQRMMRLALQNQRKTRKL